MKDPLNPSFSSLLVSYLCSEHSLWLCDPVLPEREVTESAGILWDYLLILNRRSKEFQNILSLFNVTQCHPAVIVPTARVNQHRVLQHVQVVYLLILGPCGARQAGIT